MRGRIKVIKRSRVDPKTGKPTGGGYGFVSCEDGTERFFHINSVVGGPEAFDQLEEGRAVSGEAYEDPDRPAGRQGRLRHVEAVAE